MSDVRPYVLGFEPILKEKVWGGRRLERYGKRLEPGRSYGESWEIADLASTAVSGGGGGSALSIIDRGPWRGRTVGEAVRAWGADLLGDSVWSRIRDDEAPAFPLLVKFLDAREHLSVQVHPSPEFAQQNDWAHLKTESWLVLESDTTTLPGGEVEDGAVFKGINEGVDAVGFAGAIRDASVVEHLTRHRAVRGECHTLPSGTCHALGGGVLVLEVQTPSDTTFRVYDWAKEYERSGRELHVEQALGCLSFDADRGGQAAPAAVCASSANHGVVSETDWYRMRSLTLTPDEHAALPGDGCRVVVGVGGDGVLNGEAVTLGQTLLVPASKPDVTLRAGGGGFEVCVVELLARL
ncbi:MAG: class I mannose-6-phosphate isomerase [Planctomycetota bacterium]